MSEREAPNLGPPPKASGIRRAVYLVLAGLFFLLAVLGILLPVIPATPFLLLTSYFLMRSSPRLSRALAASPFFGPILRDWQQHRGVRPHVKAQAVGMVLLVVASSVYFTQPAWPFLCVISLAALVGILVIVRLPAVRE